MSFEKQSERIAFPGIASEIKQMVEADQAMRKKWEAGDFSDDKLDLIHTDRMKAIVAEVGWPTISKVGQEGAHNAWLLVQHADHDVAFQAHCLELMQEVPANEVDQVDIAYLEDRVRVNQGRPQLYGTQFTQENDQHVPQPIEDADTVDERRAVLGLGPLSEQIQHMYEQYPLKDKG